MRNYTEHLVHNSIQLKEALEVLNRLAKDAITFVVNDQRQLLGSLTDGDVRRGLLAGLSPDDNVGKFVQPKPKFIRKEAYSIDEIIKLREGNFRILPVLNGNHEIINIINFRFLKSYLPIDAVIMAGGKGSRLRPLTEKTPKPLLKVGDKTIIDHGLNRLRQYGVDDYWVSVNYLGEKIKRHLGDGSDRDISIRYLWEERPMGTIGAVSQIDDFQHDYVLVTNSDLLTNIDYEDFFLDFVEKDADMAVVTIPYQVNVPYGVLETSDHQIISFAEKPTYTYYSNGGIYLIKRSMLDFIPKNQFFNSTDLIQELMERGFTVNSYPLRQYWLDIGKPADFERAQQDIKHIKF